MCFNIFLLCFSACVTLGLVHRVLPLWRNPAFVVKPGIYVPVCLCMIEVTWSCFPQRSSCLSSQSAHALRSVVTSAVWQSVWRFTQLCRAHVHAGVSQRPVSALSAAGSAVWVSHAVIKSSVVKHHHNLRLLPLCLVVCYCGVTVRETLCGTDRGGFDGVGHFSCEKLCGK